MTSFLIGLALLAAGALAIFVARPPAEGDTHPGLRGSAFLQALYPSICLGLLTFGIALLLSSMPDI